jgi:hypothetical protein
MYFQKSYIKMGKGYKYFPLLLNSIFHHNKVYMYKYNIITNKGMLHGE